MVIAGLIHVYIQSFVKGVLTALYDSALFIILFPQLPNCTIFWVIIGKIKVDIYLKKKEKIIEKSIRYSWKHLKNPRESDFSTFFLTHKLLFTALQRPLKRFSPSNIWCKVFATVLFLSRFSHFLSFALASLNVASDVDVLQLLLVFCHLMPSFSTDHRWINVRGGNADEMKVHLGKSSNVREKDRCTQPPWTRAYAATRVGGTRGARRTPYQWCHWEPIQARCGTRKPLSSTSTLQPGCMAAHMVSQHHIFTMLPLCCWETPQQHGDAVPGWVLAPLPSESPVSVCEPEIYRADIILVPILSSQLGCLFSTGTLQSNVWIQKKSQSNDWVEQNIFFPQEEWWEINIFF